MTDYTRLTIRGTANAAALVLPSAEPLPALLPDVPTIAESGVPGFDARVWWGMLAPAKTPRALIERLDAEMARIIDRKEVRDQLVAAGAEPGFAGADVCGKLIESELAKWAKIAHQAGVRPPK